MSLHHIDRRSQYYLADSVSASPSATDDEYEDFDEQSVFNEDFDDEASTSPTRSYDPDAAIANLQWDEDLTPGPSSFSNTRSAPGPFFLPIPQQPIRQTTEETIVPARSEPREYTPLLHKTTSLTFAEPTRRTSDNVLPVIAMPVDGPPVTVTRRISQASFRGTGQRRGSAASRVTKGVQVGQSTFGQTVRCRFVLFFQVFDLFKF